MPSKKDTQLQFFGKKTEKELSKEQKRFNRLTKQVRNLTQKIEEQKQISEELLVIYNKDISPVLTERKELEQDVVEQLFHNYNRYKFTNRQEENTYSVIDHLLQRITDKIENPRKTIIDIYNSFYEVSFEEEKEEMQMGIKQEIAQMLKDQLGVEIDINKIPDLTEDNPQEILQFIAENLQDFMKQKMNEETENKTSTEKKTKKQIEAELRKEEEEKLKQKSVRSIYISLAKVLHPDTAVNEEERERKEELMKKVTLAYENNDLAELLELEQSWLDRTSNRLSEIKEDQLSLYCDVLKEQVTELKADFDMIKNHPRYIKISDYTGLNRKKAIIQIRLELEELKDIIESIKIDIARLRTKKGTLEFVKETNESIQFSGGFEDMLMEMMMEDLFGDE